MATKRVMTKVNEPAKAEYKGDYTLCFREQLNNFIGDLNKGHKMAHSLLKERNTLYTFKSAYRHQRDITTYLVRFGNRVVQVNEQHGNYGLIGTYGNIYNGIKEEVISLKDMRPIAGQRTIKILTLYIYKGTPVEFYIDADKNELLGINTCTYYKTDSINLLGKDNGMYLNLTDPKYDLKKGVYLDGYNIAEVDGHIGDIQTIDTKDGHRLLFTLTNGDKVAFHRLGYSPTHRMEQDYNYKGHQSEIPIKSIG